MFYSSNSLSLFRTWTVRVVHAHPEHTAMLMTLMDVNSAHLVLTKAKRDRLNVCLVLQV